MSVSVIVPWRTDNGERQILWDWNRERWEKLFPYWELIEIDSFDSPFSRGKSRNQGVKKAQGDIIVIADADTIPLVEELAAAVDVAQDAGWVIAYGKDRYYNITEQKTNWMLTQDPLMDVVEPEDGEWDFKLTSWAGMIVMKKENFVPYDERFVGWGWEDNAFQSVMAQYVGQPIRVGGWVGHMWHSRGEDFNTPDELANREIFNRDYRPRWIHD